MPAPATGASVDDFVSHLRFERGLSDNSVMAYRRDLAKWVAFCAEAGVALEDAEPDHVTEFLGRLRKGRKPATVPMAPSSVARTLVSVRAFYRFLVREAGLAAEPTARVGSPSRPRSIPKAISLEQVERLIESPPRDLLGRRDTAMLEVLYGAGLRISELIALDVDDVDLD